MCGLFRFLRNEDGLTSHGASNRVAVLVTSLAMAWGSLPCSHSLPTFGLERLSSRSEGLNPIGSGISGLGILMEGDEAELGLSENGVAARDFG